jgi:hypothetical protein
VPLIWPALFDQVLVLGLLKLARLNALNISHRKVSLYRSPMLKLRWMPVSRLK